jgi:hypothetical protein
VGDDKLARQQPLVDHLDLVLLPKDGAHGGDGLAPQNKNPLVGSQRAATAGNLTHRLDRRSPPLRCGSGNTGFIRAGRANLDDTG